MNIQISTQILSGNLGEGWADNNQAAQALANFTAAQWKRDLSALTAAGHLVEIDIDVQRNTTGCGRDVSVECDDYELMIEARDQLTDEAVIWVNFCRSSEAQALNA